MSRSLLNGMWLLFFALVIIVPRASAQSTFGEIRGTVTDATGGVIAGASVTATNKGTGEVRTAITDEVGNYSLVNLLAGTYDVAVENTGFRKAVSQSVVVRAREVARADVRLEVGGATTEVTVSETRQVISTDVPTLVDSKSSKQIADLPVNFRAGGANTVFAAIATAPGVQPRSSGSEYSLGGSMPFMATSSVDGISMRY